MPHVFFSHQSEVFSFARLRLAIGERHTYLSVTSIKEVAATIQHLLGETVPHKIAGRRTRSVNTSDACTSHLSKQTSVEQKLRVLYLAAASFPLRNGKTTDNVVKAEIQDW